MSTLTVTVIQSRLHWEDKAANLAMLANKINSIQGKKELVLLPEMFSTGFSMQPERLAETMDGPTLRWMEDISGRITSSVGCFRDSILASKCWRLAVLSSHFRSVWIVVIVSEDISIRIMTFDAHGHSYPLIETYAASLM